MTKNRDPVMTAVVVIVALFLIFFGISVIGSNSMMYTNYRLPIFYGWIMFFLILIAIIAFTVWLTKQFPKAREIRKK